MLALSREALRCWYLDDGGPACLPSSTNRLARLARASRANDLEAESQAAMQGEATRLRSTLANVDIDQLRSVATAAEAG